MNEERIHYNLNSIIDALENISKRDEYTKEEKKALKDTIEALQKKA